MSSESLSNRLRRHAAVATGPDSSGLRADLLAAADYIEHQETNLERQHFVLGLAERLITRQERED